MTGADLPVSYERARTELASVVERLEAGGCTLEESLALWERGEQLAEICQRWLDGARDRLAAARDRPDRAGGPPQGGDRPDRAGGPPQGGDGPDRPAGGTASR